MSTIEDERRAASLVAISIVLGACFGLITTLPIAARWVWLVPGTLGGVVVGVLMSPLATLCLRRKRVPIAIVLIAGPTSLVTFLVASTQPRLGVLVLTPVLAYAAMLFIARIALPSVPVAPERWQCRRCGYDLRGIDGDACPECGAQSAT